MDKTTDKLSKPVPTPRSRASVKAVALAVQLEAKVLRGHAIAKREALEALRKRMLELRLRTACGGLSLEEQTAITQETVFIAASAKAIVSARPEIMPFGKVRYRV